MYNIPRRKLELIITCCCTSGGSFFILFFYTFVYHFNIFTLVGLQIFIFFHIYRNIRVYSFYLFDAYIKYTRKYNQLMVFFFMDHGKCAKIMIWFFIIAYFFLLFSIYKTMVNPFIFTTTFIFFSPSQSHENFYIEKL